MHSCQELTLTRSCAVIKHMHASLLSLLSTWVADVEVMVCMMGLIQEGNRAWPEINQHAALTVLSFQFVLLQSQHAIFCSPFSTRYARFAGASGNCWGCGIRVRSIYSPPSVLTDSNSKFHVRCSLIYTTRLLACKYFLSEYVQLLSALLACLSLYSYLVVV